MKRARSLAAVCPKCRKLGRVYKTRDGWVIYHAETKQTHYINKGDSLEVPLNPELLNLVHYYGGDSFLLKYLAKMIPPHVCYVEVFGGGGVLLLNKAPSRIEVYNDKDNNLVTLFRVVRDKPFEFIKEFNYILYSRTLFYELLHKLVKGDFRSDIERAVATYYLLLASIHGSLGSGFSTSVRQRKPHSHDIFDTLRDIKKIHRRLKYVIIENLDFRDCISKYMAETTFFYCDPPHIFKATEKVADAYNQPFSDRDYMDLLELLDKVDKYGGKFLLKHTVGTTYPLKWAEGRYYITSVETRKSARNITDKRVQRYIVYFIANYKLPHIPAIELGQSIEGDAGIQNS